MIRMYGGLGLVIMGLLWDDFGAVFGGARDHFWEIMGDFGVIWG